MKPRTLIIGAKGTADFIRAGHLVKQYIEDGFADRVPSGRYHGVIYGPADATAKGDHAYVWHTPRQITVHFGEIKS